MRNDNSLFDFIMSLVFNVVVICVVTLIFKWCIDSIFGMSSPFFPNLVLVTLFVLKS